MSHKTSLLISGAAQETGALLKEYLQVRGVYDSRAVATVCYGYSNRRRPSLNSECSTDKIERLRRMEDGGCCTVPWFENPDDLPMEPHYPLLARKRMGYGGTDIIPVFQREELKWRIAAGFDWFSEYVPVANEYRVWVFRGHHLDTYEKVMQRPENYKFIGRNFRNGFDFVPALEQRDATVQALRAITTIGLDFAAVDLLRGKDGLIYVLEVNTAPGVLKSGAQTTLGKLADHIATWVREDYPTWLR